MPARSRISELEGKVSRKREPSRPRNKICNRQDSCMHAWNASRDIFIYSIEVEEHRKTTLLVIRIFANFR
jgi:hypothetical protein